MAERRVIWEPQPRQKLFMACPADERFFGGARGGGKSDVMLGSYPKQLLEAKKITEESSAIIIRKSYKELERLIDRSKKLYPSLGGEWLSSKTTWTFPGYGILRLRHADSDSDVDKYLGQDYDWVAIDELPLYGTPYVWDRMLSSCRSAVGIPTKMIGTGNPGGAGQGWVKRRFISGKEPDIMYRYNQKIKIDDVYLEEAVTRCFIPSKVTDNKYWIENDPKYIAKLAALPEQQRRAYLDGDWDVALGQAFPEIGPEHKCAPFQIPRGWYRFGALDWGYSTPFSFGMFAVDPNGRIYRIGEYYGCVPGMENEGVRLDIHQAGRRFVQISNAMGLEVVYADPSMWANKGESNTSMANTLKKLGLNVRPGRNDRISSKNTLHSLLSMRMDDGQPAFMVFDTCVHWWRTVPNLVTDTKNIEDVDTDGEDHAYDDTRYAIMSPMAVRGVVAGNLREYRREVEERDYAR